MLLTSLIFAWCWINISRNILTVGTAVKQTTDGECEERHYNNGKLDGEATVIFPDSSKEIRNYKVCLEYKDCEFIL